MAKRTLLIASLVASVAAIAMPQNVPASCARVSTLVQSCVPDDATANDLTSTQVANCLCADSTFDDDIVTCRQDAGSVLPEAQQALQAFDGYCALYGGGSSGGGSSPTTRSATSAPTSSPTSGGDSGSGNVPAACSYVVGGVSSCWTDNNPLPTAPPVANCLCSGTDFDEALDQCYSAIVESNPDEASTINLLSGFCSSYSDGAFGPATATDDDSGTATTGFLDSPSATDTGSDDTPSSTRVIQTLNPASTSSGSTPASTSSGSETNPNSASGLKVGIIGTAVAALFAGVAMLL